MDIGIREYLKQKGVEDYRKGNISIGKAAEEAGLSIAEFYQILEDEDVPIRIDTGILRDASVSDFREAS
ncbi:MAG: UPF0175 family protein [Nitrososphaerales archaeon]